MTQLRRLEVSDVDAYRKLRLASLQSDPGAFHLQYASALTQAETFFQAEMQPEGDIFGCHGLFDSHELVGMVILRPVETDSVQLFTLYVLPKFRERGLASRLIDHCLSISSRAGLRRIQLCVMQTNPAIQLYRAKGFKEIKGKEQLRGEILLEREIRKKHSTIEKYE